MVREFWGHEGSEDDGSVSSPINGRQDLRLLESRSVKKENEVLLDSI